LARPLLLDQPHLQLARAVQGRYLGHQAAGDDRFFRIQGVPIDQLLIIIGMGRTGRGQIVDRFQEIGFALGVVAM